MRDEKHYSLKVRSVYLLVIINMLKVIYFFNHIVMKLLLEEMLNLMKISWPESLISTPVPSSIPILVSSYHFHRFLDGSIQHEKQLVVLSVILQISIEHVHNSNEPLLFWLKF
jgi:hypothetical protein